MPLGCLGVGGGSSGFGAGRFTHTFPAPSASRTPASLQADWAEGGGEGGSGLGSPAPWSPQAIATREELHAQHSRSLREKDALRKQVRELAEKADDLQLQLFQLEGQLLAAEGRLKRQQLDALVLVGLLGAGGLRGLCPLLRAAALP